MRLKEQLRFMMQNGGTDARDKQNLERDFRIANSQKTKLAAQKEALLKDNVRLKEHVSKPGAKAGGQRNPLADKDSPLAQNIAQLEQQLAEKKEDAKVVEDMLQGEIARLASQCEALQQKTLGGDEDAARREGSLAKELQEFTNAKIENGPNKEVQYTMIEQQLEKSLEKQKTLQARLLKVNEEKSKIEEEWTKAEYEWERKWEQCQEQRKLWQQDREASMSAKTRLEKVEAVLKQQVTSAQEKLETLQKREEEAEQERRTFRTKVQQLETDLQRSSEERENAMQTRGKDLEIEVGALQLEAQNLQAEIKTLWADKEETDRRCQALRLSVEQLEERQRYFPSTSRSNRSGKSGKSGPPRSMRSLSSRGSSRFRSSLKGPNCSMTLDGSTVTRTKGCRQCVVIGDHALDFFAGTGWYFELRINEVVTGWVGGLGLGVTLTHPSAVAALPDRAWRIPESWMAGYWGRMFTNGQQHLIDWKPQELRSNDKVGFLVTPQGHCIVYVNGEEKVNFSEVPVPVESGDVELTALVDVFASTASVSLCDSHPPEAAEAEEDEDDA